MKKLLSSILRLLPGRSQARSLSPAEFTQECAKAFAEAGPQWTVLIERDLVLSIKGADDQESRSFLDNLYETCRQHPHLEQDAIDQFVVGTLETLAKKSDGTDRTCIVPVIKDRAWLEEMRRGLRERGATDVPDPVHEDFSRELVIVYAIDMENSIAFLTPGALEEAKVSREELRVLAASNLKRLLPKIERAGSNGLYMFMAGGTYEASLLLLDTIWAGIQAEVQGDVVVAIPTRDVLVATGSENAPGMSKLREIAQEAWQTGPYRLTPQLFVYRDGTFQEFEPA
ncbi:MAG: DUF1444 family protein [Candidatus Hydrogenedentes bacterium]|nr:DUF1444 family protein [Candidatus Hydrogenedentota bacterium]